MITLFNRNAVSVDQAVRVGDCILGEKDEDILENLVDKDFVVFTGLNTVALTINGVNLVIKLINEFMKLLAPFNTNLDAPTPSNIGSEVLDHVDSLVRGCVPRSHIQDVFSMWKRTERQTLRQFWE
jgi:hypothetical protein